MLEVNPGAVLPIRWDSWLLSEGGEAVLGTVTVDRLLGKSVS